MTSKERVLTYCVQHKEGGVFVVSLLLFSGGWCGWRSRRNARKASDEEEEEEEEMSAWSLSSEEAGDPRFAQRRGLGARRGWDLRMGDEEDSESIRELASRLGCGTADMTLLNVPGVSWHVLEASADERLLGCLATVREGRTAVFEVVLAVDDDARKALITCAEAAARCQYATTCLLHFAHEGYDQTTDTSWTKHLGEPVEEEEEEPSVGERFWPPSSEGKPLFFPPKENAALRDDDDDDNRELDALSAQLELAASVSRVASDLARDLDDSTSDDVKREEGDDSLEDLVGSLLKVLKTTDGKRQFTDLAERQRLAKQDDIAHLAPRTFVPRPPLSNDDEHIHQQRSTETTTSCTVGNARAFAELLASDTRFQEALK